MTARVGILTGGGDAPGLNAVIRAFTKRSVGQYGAEVIGIADSFDGLMIEPRRTWSLQPRNCQGLLQRGGTILGTTNKGDPFALHTANGVEDRSRVVADAVKELSLDGLICIGGDGTQRIALRLMRERGVPIIGVPKTIDNDLHATDYTFGFHSAVAVATDALDRLHTTAESHDRVMLLEVMGRDTGHIALAAGIAGGADAILIPEIPYRPELIAAKVLRRRAVGRPFSIIIVAEGAVPDHMAATSLEERKQHVRRAGGAAQLAMKSLGEHLEADMRVTVLGHLQRGGSPIPFDRLLATRFGACAADLAHAGRWGEMVRLRHGVVDGVKMDDDVTSTRFVDPDGQWVEAARAVGVEFGG